MATSKKTNNKTKSTRGKSAQQKRTSLSDIAGIIIICISAVSLIVLLATSDPGNIVRSLLDGLGGRFSILLPFVFLWIGFITVFSSTHKRNFGKILMISCCILLVFAMGHIFDTKEILGRLQLKHGWMNFIQQSFFERSGTGAIGALFAYPVYSIAGEIGGFAMLLFTMIALIAVMNHFSPRQFGEKASQYIQDSYSDYQKIRSERSADRAIQKADQRKKAEARRAAREAEKSRSAHWSDTSWDNAVFSTPIPSEPSGIVNESVSSHEDSTAPHPRKGSFLEVPEYLKEKNRSKKPKPAFGESKSANSSDPLAPFPRKKSQLASFTPDDDEAVYEFHSAHSEGHSPAEDTPAHDPLPQTDNPVEAPLNIDDPYEDYVFPEEDLPDEDASYPSAEDVISEYIESAHEDLPDISEYSDTPAEDDSVCPDESDFMIPPFDPDQPVQRERRRKVLGEPVKQEKASSSASRYAPDDYVPNEDYVPNLTLEPGVRLDHSPIVITKHKDAIPDGNSGEYNYPPVDLLSLPKPITETDREAKDKEKAKKLESTLHDFGINARLIGTAHGPAVTRFELAPAPGVKVSKITSLSDDIALSLAALSVRIEAPIPGKAAVGVEIPNETVETVPLREVLESSEARKHPSRLAVALGKDNSGRYIIGDIAKMPHVLIAGATGSGKSVCINCIICSILYRATPEEVRLIMIDPKVVELSIYNAIPHLLVPVVTDPKKASGALQWAVAEMTDRYKKFAERGVKDIKGYNLKCGPDEKPMPQIVIIIDELADLMMAAPGEVEDSICRLAQLARAAGIHLVIATQRPSVNVITGVIKANIPARIAFTVASFVDSKTILDVGGAEKLLGRGDMLFAPAGSNRMQRVQGAWVDENEVNAIVDYIKARHDVEYNDDVIEHMNKANDDSEASSDDSAAMPGDNCDELLQPAIDIAITAGQASISMLQRRLRIGYARAGRLIDEMAERGIVSQSEGAKPRSVLITREQFNEMFPSAPTE